MASTTKEQQFHMQILEVYFLLLCQNELKILYSSLFIFQIVTFMLQNQNPAILAKVELQRSKQEKDADVAKLALIRGKEQKEKMAKIKKYAGSR